MAEWSEEAKTLFAAHPPRPRMSRIGFKCQTCGMLGVVYIDIRRDGEDIVHFMNRGTRAIQVRHTGLKISEPCPADKVDVMLQIDKEGNAGE